MSDRPQQPRNDFVAIDVIKTFAIIAVVSTHSVLGSNRAMHTAWDDLVGRGWVAFHVPSFLAISGFLYFSDRAIPGSTVLERLGRILVPYTVASFVAYAVGAMPENDPGVWLRFLTGNVQGHYYYVVLIASYIPLIWIFSRIPRSTVALLALALALYPLIAYYEPSFRFAESFMTRMRNPLYTAIYFVAGWALRAYLPEVRTLGLRLGPRRFWWLVSGFGSACILFYFVGPMQGTRWQVQLANRMVYTAGVVAVVSGVYGTIWNIGKLGVFVERGTRGWIFFVSKSTYTIYLYHFLFIYPALQITLQWPPLARILAVFGLAFAGGCLVSAIGSRLMGPRSRWLLGTA